MNAVIENPIVKLIEKLEEQKNRKRDLIVPTSKLKMTEDLNIEVINNNALSSSEYFSPNEIMKEGLSEKLGIPRGYYRKMESNLPNLLQNNVNGWLGFQEKK